MKRFYKEKLLDESIQGAWENVQLCLKTPNEERTFSDKKELQTIDKIIGDLYAIELRTKQEESLYNDFEMDDNFVDYEEVNTESGAVFYAGKEPY